MARRLEGEPVALLLAARDTAVPAQLDRQVDRLTIEPLDPAAAGRLLDHQPRPPAGRARSRVLEQAAGVPSPSSNSPGPWRATRPPPTRTRCPHRPAGSHLRRGPSRTSPATRELLLFAAAAESAELPVILSAVGDRATPDDWLPAERAGLVRVDADRVRFRHPLIRSAVYRAATYTERHTAHRALADVLVGDPDRRAWHHAAAASGVDEEAARELDDSAARAQRRGGYAAAATALERAARLSPDPTVRAGRLVRAATMAMYAGHPRWVGELSAQVATLTDEPALLAEASLRAGWALAVTTRFAGSLGFLLPVAEAAVDEDPVLTSTPWRRPPPRVQLRRPGTPREDPADRGARAAAGRRDRPTLGPRRL